MIDILAVEPTEAFAIEQLVRCLNTRLKPAEVDDLLFVLDQWDRSISDADRLVIERFRRAQVRGDVSPALLRAYLVTVARLSQTPEWRAVMRWRRRISKLKPIRLTKASSRSRKAA